MKSKPIIMAAILGLTAGGAIFAGQLLFGGSMPKAMLNADEPSLTPHTATITSLPFTSLYRNKTGEMQNKYLAMPLNTPGVYAQIEISSFNNVEFGGGHLFTATMDDPKYQTWFCIDTRAPKDDDYRLFETEADYPSNPLNVVGFRELTGIDVYLAASTEVDLKNRDGEEDYGYNSFTYTYDSENHIQTIRGDISPKVDPFRFEFDKSSYNAGDKFIVDRIVLYYNC